MYDKIIDSIYNENLKEFATEVVNQYPSYYRNMTIAVADNKSEQIEKYTEDLYSVVRTILSELDVDDIIYDMFAVAVILQYAGRFEIVSGFTLESTLYPLEVRGMFKDFESLIGREMYHDIMSIVESQMGLSSPIPQVIHQVDESVLLWTLPIANAVVRAHNI